MKRIELIGTEEEYYVRLSDDEKKLYLADNKILSAIDTVNDANVRSFVEVSRLMNELHRIHERYNTMIEEYEQFTTEDHPLVISHYRETFQFNMSIGCFSSVLSLESMDECDALYSYLSTLKMNRFDYMTDNFDVDYLIEIVGLHSIEL